MMKNSTTKMMMKAVGATLAICSAMTMIEGCKMSSCNAKKAVKKTAKRVEDIVDMMSSIM